MFRFLLPKDGGFFDFFEQHIVLVIEACNELLDLATHQDKINERISRIKDLEHKTDTITQHCIETLHKTFITPIDRTDIHRLIKRLDDIIDSVDTATSRILIYEIKEIRPEVKEMAVVLVKATTEIQKALKCLRNLKNANLIDETCRAIHQAEHEGDVIHHKALARLFKDNTETTMIIKWKEIFEILEMASDRCEDVANVIQGVLIEAS